jgi:hypothetical protein
MQVQSAVAAVQQGPCRHPARPKSSPQQRQALLQQQHQGQQPAPPHSLQGLGSLRLHLLCKTSSREVHAQPHNSTGQQTQLMISTAAQADMTMTSQFLPRTHMTTSTRLLACSSSSRANSCSHNSSQPRLWATERHGRVHSGCCTQPSKDQGQQAPVPCMGPFMLKSACMLLGQPANSLTDQLLCPATHC